MRWPWTKKTAVEALSATPSMPGPRACLATEKAVTDGFGVYYFWRSESCNEMDSGWIFAHGTEDDDYINDPNNSRVYDIDSIAHLHPEILPHLDGPVGAAFYWDGSKFLPDPLGSPENKPSLH